MPETVKLEETSDEDAVYIELEDSGLKTGDVVLQGTGEDAAQVTLSELLPHAGFMWQTAPSRSLL